MPKAASTLGTIWRQGGFHSRCVSIVSPLCPSVIAGDMACFLNAEKPPKICRRLPIQRRKFHLRHTLALWVGEKETHTHTLGHLEEEEASLSPGVARGEVKTNPRAHYTSLPSFTHTHTSLKKKSARAAHTQAFFGTALFILPSD